MSASPTKAPEPAHNVTDAGAVRVLPTPQPPIPGHEALQALLAFSSLHEQIRQRRAREVSNGARMNSDDVWELEQFVLDEVLQLVAERALAITGADGVAIALAEGNAIVCRGSAGTIAPDAGARLDPSSGFSGACLRNGQIVRCDDAETDPRVNVQACRRLGARSMVAVPLSGRYNVIGLLEAFSSEAYGFNDSDVRSLNLLGELILAAMKPEEEDRLAEISQRVVAGSAEPADAEAPTVPDVHPESVLVPAESGEASPEPDGGPTLFLDHQVKEQSRPGLAVVLLVVLLAVVVGGGLWWKIGHEAHPATANRQQSPPIPRPQIAKPTPAVVAPADDQSPPSATHENFTGMPRVTGVRHWSAADSSTVVIDLQDQVQYEAHRLSDPERIYFDLRDTTLAPGLFGKTIEIKDARVLRVRVAQPTRGVTRVVLETTGTSDFSVSLESNPYRLVVEVRSAGTPAPAKAKVDLFDPASQGAVHSDQASGAAAQARQLESPAESARIDKPQVRPQAPKFRLVLDAGHGGWDLGTVGRKGLLEKDLVLDIVDRLGSLVKRRLGTEVTYTRQDDTYVALEKRAEIANLAQADLFVSIHANYSALPSARGVETYYSRTYSSVKARTPEADATALNVSWTNIDIREKVQESRRVAASIQRALYNTLAAKNPSIRDRGVKEASYVVLTGTSMPAILAEVSFVSSPADESKLQSSAYRQRIAEALYQGIARYATESHRVKMASTSGKPTGR